MPLHIPKGEDLGKLHREVTQLVHHRFILTTLAITVYGAVTAWVVPGPAEKELSTFLYVASTILLVLLLTLFLFSFALSRILRTLTAYLRVTEASGWELDSALYRKDDPLGYSRAHAYVFLVLGSLSVALPFLLAQAYSVGFGPSWGRTVLLLAGLAYVLTVIFVGIVLESYQEKRAMDTWSELNERTPNVG